MSGAENVVTTPGSAAHDVDGAGVVSGTEILLVLARAWRFLAAVGIGAGVGGVVLALLLPLRYTASFAFLPENRPGTSAIPTALGGIAAQLGISTAGGGGESPPFYVAVITSRRLATALLGSRLAAATGPDPEPLWRKLGYRDLESAVAGYAKVVESDASARTNLVSVRVNAPSPELAAHAAERLIDLIIEFNTSTRRLNAHQRRLFVEQRAREADAALRSAEDSLRGFLIRNRGDVIGSPNLRFEYDRLQRRVRLREEVDGALLRQLDESRIAEADDIPNITVVDPPVVPQRKSGPRRKLIVIGVEFGAMAACALWVLGAEALRRLARRNPEMLAAYRSALLSRSP
jgi:uncharacterized protein involved in exopolysaccharide biosynthesis